MSKMISVSFIVPAYNEEKNIEKTIINIKKVVHELKLNYEIIIINDNSKDNTIKVIERLNKKDKNIIIINNHRNQGLGFSYIKGVKIAKKEYCILVPGDNEIEYKGIVPIIKLAGKADIIIPYPRNPGIRTITRRIISNLFVFIMNLLMGLNIKYYNGIVLHKTKLVKQVKVKTKGFAYQAEILSKLIKSGYSYIEVKAMDLKRRQYGSTKIFAPKNIFSIAKTIVLLMYEIRIKKNNKNIK